MSLFRRLLAETEADRAEFLAIPILGRALKGQVPRALYVEFLKQAYHHVRHTCPLLSLAAAKTEDGVYRAALYDYIAEEQGHDEWILADIDALGGDADGAKRAPARPPCRAMVAYAYYAIDWISPYAMLGMVHVLEGMSIQLALQAATALKNSLGAGDGRGFLYLTSHGTLDADHTAFFEDLVNRLQAPSAAAAIIDGAKMTYWLYGNIFRDLEHGVQGIVHVARG